MARGRGSHPRRLVPSAAQPWRVVVVVVEGGLVVVVVGGGNGATDTALEDETEPDPCGVCAVTCKE